MIRFGKRDQLFAISLSALAGYVDAIGFISAGGFFVSFMSGNLTRLSVGLVYGTPSASMAAGLIASFLSGVVLGTLFSEWSGGRSRVILLLVAALLATATAADLSSYPKVGIFIVAAAMGAENAIFTGIGDAHMGVTYMTGTLVKFAQRLAYGFMVRPSPGWLHFLLLWLGLLSGAVVGSLAYRSFGLSGLALAAIAAALLAFYQRRGSDCPIEVGAAP
jgi:uncharacterized membrane protein YoaK (UPF0700 family)